MLGGIDQETFQHRFGLSHDELVRGGMQIIQGGGDLGSILFAAGAGVDRLREVQATLEQLSQDLFKPGGTKGAINQAIKRFREQKKDLADTQMLPAEYERRRDALKSKRDEIAAIEIEQNQVAAELDSLKRLRDAMPLIPKWNSIQEKLSEIGDVPLLDKEFVERRRTAQSSFEAATLQQGELTKRMAALKSELDELSDDSDVMVHQTQIVEMFQKLGAREEALQQCGELQKTCDRLERHLRQKLLDLKVDVPATDDTEKLSDAIEKLRLTDTVETTVDQLALKHETLVNQQNEAEKEVDSLTRQLATLETEWAAADHDADPESLSELIDSVGKPDDWLNQLARQKTKADQAERNCKNLHQRLTGIEATFREAARLRLPSESRIETAAARMRETTDAVALAKSRQDDLTDKRDEVNRRLKTQQAGQPLPTLAELQQVRQDRDALVGDLYKAITNESASPAQIDALKMAIHEADQLVDAIRLHHEQVHRRSMDLAKRDELNDEILQNESVIESAVEVSDSAQEEWMALWKSVGIVADAPKRMLRWVADHEQLVKEAEQWEDEQKRLQEIQQQIDSSCQRLRKALSIKQLAETTGGGSGAKAATLFDISEGEPDDSTDFLSLYQNAVSLRRKLADAREHRIDLQKRTLVLKEDLPKAQSDLNAKQKLVATWKTEWEAATKPFASDSNSSPSVVVDLVRQIKSLTAQKRERDSLAKRIRSIRSNEEEFVATVNRLATTIDDDSDAVNAKKDPHGFIGALFKRLQREQSASAKRASLQKQIADVESKLTDAMNVQSECQAILKQLCDETRCESASELVEIERRSFDRSEYVRQKSELEGTLQYLAAGESIVDLVKQAGRQDAGVLDVEIETKARLLDDLKHRLSQCESERGVLKLRLEEVDAGNEAADLSQSLQMLGGQLQRDAKEYARLKIATMLLQRSIERYREENQGPVLGYAQDLFRELTCGEYRELRVDYLGDDQPTLAGVQSTQASGLVPASLMSTGTADALYLSLRLASLRHQLSHGSKIPLIVDDCLVQLDDRRTIAALKVFAKLSLDTQVILFTHHQHLVQLAKSNLKANEFHSHQLSTAS